jgi:hypothetical protein
MSAGLPARYGAEVLAEGYVAIPRLLLRHRRALGISAGEWLYLVELFGYWRADGDPYPGVMRLAEDLGVDASTVRRYRIALEAKGLLRVYREGRRQRYDLRALLATAVELERHRAKAPEARAGTRTHRAVVHAEKEMILEKEQHDQDMTPSPQCQTFDDPGHDTGAGATTPMTRPVPTDDLAPGSDNMLAARLAVIGAQLGDDTPASSLTRATNLEREFGVSRKHLLEGIETAARRVCEAAPSFRILGADGRPNGMHYFFGVLRRELRGATRRAPQRARMPGTQPPPPAPITEVHPVWRAALEVLRTEMTATAFATWLAPTRALGQEGTALRVAVPSPLHRLWLERIAGRIAEALERGGHGELLIEYVVQEASPTGESANSC